MRQVDTIVCFCAHNDDQIIGAGGTIAKYAQEGKDVYTIIFSYGESSHPHLKREITVQMRVKESLKAARIVGGKQSFYLGLREGHFAEGFAEKNMASRMTKFVEQKNPSKIFVHSRDDPHPDHLAVHKIVTEFLDGMRYKGSVFTFNVWNPVTIMRRKPRLVVDISNTFNRKMRAMQQHQSQRAARFSLWWNLYLKAYINGLNNGFKYAEVFYKIR